MRSDPSPSRHQKTTTARRAGRHRAPARGSRAAKVLRGVTPVVLLAGAFTADQGLQQHPQRHVIGMAAAETLALRAGNAVTDGSGVAIVTRSAAGNPGGQTVTAAATTSPQAAKAQRSHHASAAASTPSPAASHPAVSARPAAGISSAGLKAAVQKDIASGNYLLAVAQYLVENGYSDAAAAGVASCVDGESGGNPESIGSGGGGLIGWTPLSSAAPNPNIVTGNVTQDMMNQLSDLLYYNSTEIGQSLVNQLNSISSPVSAADYFSLNFEKPAVTYSDVVPSVADQIYAELKP